MKLGFIRSGMMGEAVAKRLAQVEHEMDFISIGAVPRLLLSRGAKSYRTLEQVTAQSGLIFIRLPNTPHTIAILYGENGYAKDLSVKKSIVGMDSILPIKTKTFAQQIPAAGTTYPDLSIFARETVPHKGTLTILSSGGGSDTWPGEIAVRYYRKGYYLSGR